MRIRTVLTTLAAVLALTACGSGEQPTTTTDSPTGPSTGAPSDAPKIPDGSYERHAGTLHQVYKFAGTAWTESNANDDAPLQLGSSGALSYDGEGNVVLHEECCGDTVISWTMEGDTLTMKVVQGNDPADKIMRDGTYTKIS